MTDEFDAAMHKLIKASSVKLCGDIKALAEEHDMDTKHLQLVAPCVASYVFLKSETMVYHNGLQLSSKAFAEYVTNIEKLKEQLADLLITDRG